MVVLVNQRNYLSGLASAALSKTIDTCTATDFDLFHSTASCLLAAWIKKIDFRKGER